MRIGIVGAGKISATHARAARAIEGLTVAAVYGTNAEKTAALAAESGAPAFADYDRFLAHGLDMVIVGSPSGLHAEHAIAAARQGLHVLVEKPLHITTAGIDALIDAVSRAGVTLGVCFQDRLQPNIHALKTSIGAGALGAPVMASGKVKWYRPPEYYAGSRWRGTWTFDGGGALMNQAIHTVDLLLWLFGPIARVSATVATRVHAIEVEDTAVAVMEFESGALGTIEAATSVYPGYVRRIELTGTEGTVVIEHDRVVRSDLRGSNAILPAATSDAALPRVSDTRAHQRLIRDFVTAVATRGAPVCDGPDGRRSVAVIEAMYESARTGRRVDVGRTGGHGSPAEGERRHGAS
jgi:predicted dehydrogenase